MKWKNGKRMKNGPFFKSSQKMHGKWRPTHLTHIYAKWTGTYLERKKKRVSPFAGETHLDAGPEGLEVFEFAAALLPAVHVHVRVPVAVRLHFRRNFNADQCIHFSRERERVSHKGLSRVSKASRESCTAGLTMMISRGRSSFREEKKLARPAAPSPLETKTHILSQNAVSSLGPHSALLKIQYAPK